MIENTIIVPIIQNDHIFEMVDSLYKNTPDNFRIIVIDQTPRGRGRYSEAIYPLLKTHLWIRSYRNLGFAKAMNMGIQLANTPYITLANDDIVFMNPSWWQGIIDTFKMDKNIIAVNPMSPKEGAWGYGLRSDNFDTWVPKEGYVRDPDDPYAVIPVKKDGTPFVFKEHFTQDDYDFLLNENPNWGKDTVCDAVAMWCTVFKREGLQEIGLLDERFYPGGGEDYDMDCRAYSCAWPEPREKCNPEFHRRMVGTTKSWVWHKWGKSKDDISGKRPNDALFSSRKRWNNNDELWPYGFDVWGHHTNENGEKIPLKRDPEVFIDEL